MYYYTISKPQRRNVIRDVFLTIQNERTISELKFSDKISRNLEREKLSRFAAHKRGGSVLINALAYCQCEHEDICSNLAMHHFSGPLRFELVLLERMTTEPFGLI